MSRTANHFACLAGTAALFLLPGVSHGTPRGSQAAFDQSMQDRAAAGKIAYEQHCAVCHGTALTGASAPALAGEAIMTDFGTEAALLDFVSTAMPLQVPGQLPAGDYADIVAYILVANGTRTGGDRFNYDLKATAGLSPASIAGTGRAPIQAPPDEDR